jgi:hypothetical protein
VQLGARNDLQMIVKSGLQAGDEVALSEPPLASAP